MCGSTAVCLQQRIPKVGGRQLEEGEGWGREREGWGREREGWEREREGCGEGGVGREREG